MGAKVTMCSMLQAKAGPKSELRLGVKQQQGQSGGQRGAGQALQQVSTGMAEGHTHDGGMEEQGAGTAGTTGGWVPRDAGSSRGQVMGAVKG